MWMWLASLGSLAWSADPPAPAPKVITEINVIPSTTEGSVKLMMPGRDGDVVYVDGWNAGTLPVQTDLAEGPHLFRVEGPAGKHEVSIYVTVAKDKVTDIDLSAPKAQPAPAPAP